MQTPSFGRAAAWVALLATALALPGQVRAQQPAAGDTLTVSGVVLDATAGTGVAGAFLQLGEDGPRAIADSTGAFRIAGARPGVHRLTVQRFGYLPLALDVTVASPTPRLQLRLEVDAVALQGLTVTGGVRVALGGSVIDDATGEPIPWAGVWLTPDGVREEAVAAADDRGVFLLPERPVGSYLLGVERIGYESQYVAVGLTAPPQPVEVRLRPDSALMAGIAAFDGRRRSRRNSSPYLVRTFDENALRFSRSHGMRQFLQHYAGFAPCGGSSGFATMSAICAPVRGRMAVPSVQIDELRSDIDHLESYNPDELYAVEVFRCGTTVRIHAYTYAFIDRMGRRPRGMFPVCIG